MENFKIHGKGPFHVAVIHGGPGAIGDMSPVARELSKKFGVLEPLETKTSIDGQIEELKIILQKNGDLPVTLIGHSWGAWLSIIFAAQNPQFIKELILVGSAPFEKQYEADIMKARLSHLNNEDIENVFMVIEKLNNPETSNEEIKKFLKFIAKADSYNAAFYEEGVRFDVEIFRKVWGEASQLRNSGQLLTFCRNIKCPVTAIHGSYDPHPYQGVKEILSGIIKDFKFILLEKCGHTPWIEKEARTKFYENIYSILNSV